jgi:hypothetical protein
MLIAAAAGLLADSDKVSAGTAHPGEAGLARETNMLEALRSLLPGRFAVRRGSVLGKGGVTSQQLDVVVCDLGNFPEFAYGSETSLLLPDSVYGVVSVRTYLRPSDVETHFSEAAMFKAFMSDALGADWRGFYLVVAYRWDGDAEKFLAGYIERSLAQTKGRSLDLAVALDHGPLCFSLETFGTLGIPPSFLAHRAHVSGMSFDPCRVDTDRPFADAYKLMLLALDKARLQRVIEIAGPPPGVAVPTGVSWDPALQAVFAGKSADVELVPGQTANFQMFYANVGTAEWRKGTPAEARLVVAGPAGYELPAGWRATSDGTTEYTGQLQDIVTPGSLALFSFNLTAPADAKPGRYEFYARPSIEGVGALTPESRANVVIVRGPERAMELGSV